jgi:hypothetical protein
MVLQLLCIDIVADPLWFSVTYLVNFGWTLHGFGQYFASYSEGLAEGLDFISLPLLQLYWANLFNVLLSISRKFSGRYFQLDNNRLFPYAILFTFH